MRTVLREEGGGGGGEEEEEESLPLGSVLTTQARVRFSYLLGMRDTCIAFDPTGGKPLSGTTHALVERKHGSLDSAVGFAVTDSDTRNKCV